MGITGFHKCLRENYPTAFRNRWLDSYDHVYIDLNFALHYCSHGAVNIQHIYEKLFHFFDSVLHETMPRKSLTLASDGSAPLAKLLIQRKRRLTKARTVDKNTEFSSLMFTPSTNFMNDLKNNLQEYIKYIEQTYCIKVNYMDPDVDEAELKLKYKLSKNVKKYPDDTQIFVTNDADVIVMLGSLPKYHNAFVFFKSGEKIETMYFGKMLDLHTTKYGNSVNMGLDFMAINIMLGNDYLPKINFIDFQKLWNSYKQIICTNPNGMIYLNNDDISINKTFFIKFLRRIVAQIKFGFIKRIELPSMFNTLYQSYTDGYLWCINTYYYGKCTRYDYMYNSQSAPHPFALLTNVEHNNALLDYNNYKSQNINPNLYAIILMPKSALSFINAKYIKFAEKHDILYDEEMCKECNQFYDDIKKYDGDIQKIKIIKNKMISHKRKHDDITVNDINKIIVDFNNFMK